MSVGLWHEDPPGLRVPGVTLNREFFVNSGVQKALTYLQLLGVFLCVCVFFFMKSHVTYFSLITCIIVTKRKTSVYLYTHNTPDIKCVLFHTNQFSKSLFLSLPN